MIFNIIGIAMCVVAYLIATIFPTSEEGIDTRFLAWGNLIGLIDFGYRVIRNPEGDKFGFFHPKRGGQIFFIPVWIVGIFFGVVGLIQGT